MDSKRILSFWLRYLHNRYGEKRNRFPHIIWLTDRRAVPDAACVISELPRGGMVMIRDYDHPEREAYAQRIALRCRQEDHPFSIAGDGRLARRTGARRLHMGAMKRREMARWRKKYPHWWITMAAHSFPELLRAARLGADAALLSPVFRTRTHENVRALGLLRLRNLVRKAPLPVYALGGITYDALPRFKTVPVMGVAAIRGFKRR